jgi:hypothetical protein
VKNRSAKFEFEMPMQGWTSGSAPACTTRGSTCHRLASRTSKAGSSTALPGR